MTRWLAWIASGLVGIPAGASAAGCTVSAVDVVFGTYQPFSNSYSDFNGTITVDCAASSGTNPIEVTLNVGSVLGGGSSYSERNMAKGTDFLGFNLYKDAGHTIVWGDGTDGSQTVTATASLAVNGGSTTFTVYGRIRRRQQRYDPPGNYMTVITATLTY